MVLGAVTKDVIFRIGSSGNAATAAKFAAVALAVGVIGKKLNDTRKEAQEFGQVVSRLQIDMSQFNSETKGLIDTMDSYIGANALSAAKMNLNKNEMAALGKAAISLGKSINIGPTEAFNMLIKDVSKGSSRVLKQLGIDLENTEDLALAQAEAVDKLTAMYGEYNVEIETTAERTYALDNALGTIKLQLVDAAWGNFVESLNTITEAVTGLQGGLDGLSEQLSENEGDLARYVTSWEGMKNQFNTFIADMIGNERKLMALDRERENALEIMDLKRQIREQKRLDQDIANTKKKLEIQLAANARQRQLDRELAATADDYTFSNKEAGTTGDGKGKAKGPKFDSFSIRRIEIAENTADSLISIEEKRVFDMNTLYDSQLKYEENAAKESLKRQETALKESLKRDLEAQKQNEKMKQDAVAGSMQFSRDLSSLMETESKAAFNVGKTAAIAEATVSTSLGAQKAFTSLAGIPIVGPVLGGLAAAAAVTAGAIRIKKIKDTKFGGGGSVSTSSGVGLPSSSVGNTASVNTGQQEEIIDRRPIQVIMDGKMITDQIITESVKRQKQGDKGLQVRA